ncbi:MAG: prepilin-type N-terminal cleavage/methylation domain-containing protein [Actinobacteria bacterium]|nr:prepilin-type N-terminal cleavage/methylation domain-containing protein [Cyanobacteriota bacterium]MCL5771272.1 prepilin-type N-terminal cleavage/methylation domain-containing protein [Actinomycetota bacterium]
MKIVNFNYFKKNKGFTLIEVLIAVVILALISVMTVEGVRMSRVAYNINKTKTQASQIANEEIEKIRSMAWNDIGIINGDPAGTLSPQKTTSDGYTVEYNVKWVPDSGNKVKQVKISVFKAPMQNKFELISEIIQAGQIVVSSSTTTTTSETTTSSSTTTTIPATTTTPPSSTTTTVPPTSTTIGLPAPRNLIVVSDLINSKKNRIVTLDWDAPLNPPYGISSYKVYRDGVFLKNVNKNSTKTTDSLLKDYTKHSYYVTVLYSNGSESSPSNIVTTVPSNL